jgi:16S rRNA (guanine527-N7)-methyltransferase
MNSRDFQDRLTRRARRAGAALHGDLGHKLEVYYRLLATWNQKINLTGMNLGEPTPEAIDRLLIEPLVAARHAPSGARRIIDIGSGGGSPAIPFTLAVPGSDLLMVESKTRKSIFLREALRALEMTDSSVATSRFEELLTRPALHEAHDILTLRAVRLETRILMNLQALVKPGGQIFLFRSTSTVDPADSVTPPLAWRATYPLVEPLRSRLVVLDKRMSRSVPRGTTRRDSSSSNDA